MTSATEKTVIITPPNLGLAQVRIRGIAPYVQHKFSAKSIAKIEATQRAGSQARSKKVREARDFDEDCRNALHMTDDGRCGIPAPAFRNAMISACRLVGFQMTKAKMSVFIRHDALDKDDRTPLVYIEGKWHPHMAYVRNETGVVDLRCRPMWDEWEAVVSLQWDEGQFSGSDVFNLLARAGLQVGIGEGRPDSKNSTGQGWGIFEIAA